MPVWRVYCGNRYTGFTETNHKWASEYWHKYGQKTGRKYTLREVKQCLTSKTK